MEPDDSGSRCFTQRGDVRHGRSGLRGVVSSKERGRNHRITRPPVLRSRRHRGGRGGDLPRPCGRSGCRGRDRHPCPAIGARCATGRVRPARRCCPVRGADAAVARPQNSAGVGMPGSSVQEMSTPGAWRRSSAAASCASWALGVGNRSWCPWTVTMNGSRRLGCSRVISWFSAITTPDRMWRTVTPADITSNRGHRHAVIAKAGRARGKGESSLVRPRLPSSVRLHSEPCHNEHATSDSAQNIRAPNG